MDNVCWWKLNEYATGGVLESSVLDVQESPSWQDMQWTCEEPPGTSVFFQVRASDDDNNMGTWSDTLTSPCNLQGIIDDQDSLFQYRMILVNTDPDTTPTLLDVTVNWLPYTGISESEDMDFGQIVFYGASTNPSQGSVVLNFSLALAATVNFCVYDMSGREISAIQGEYQAGPHEIILDDLAPGIFFCRITSNDYSATQRFVVIE